MIDGNIITGLFISIGTISYIQSLEVRNIGTWCTGMYFHCSDGTIEGLGEQDPSRYSTMSYVYRKYIGIIATINFRVSGSVAFSYVKDITIELVDEEPLLSHVLAIQRIF